MTIVCVMPSWLAVGRLVKAAKKFALPQKRNGNRLAPAVTLRANGKKGAHERLSWASRGSLRTADDASVRP
jgi:hypothetical protein